MTKPIVPQDGVFLPVYDKLLNPLKGNDLFVPGEGSVCYIVRRGDAKLLKAFTSAGPLKAWKVGAKVQITSDQSRRNLGVHTIVGIVQADGKVVGDVPNGQLQHAVAK